MMESQPADEPLSRQTVLDAHERIKQHIHRTPVLTSQTLDALASSRPIPSSSNPSTTGLESCASKESIHLYFKCENYQKIGAFKARGAFHALSRLSDEELSHGVITHSSGNHAAALALAAKTRGVKAIIVMPYISQPSKIAATQSHGPEVIFSGSTSEEREEVVNEAIARTGARLVPPYDHPDIIAGQGTAGLELQEQVRELRGDTTELDAVIVPTGGGGLLSGVALSFQGTSTKVFGSEPSFEGANDAERGLAADPPTRVQSVKTLTIADGLRTPLGAWPWKIINSSLVAGVYSVSEIEIIGAMRLVLERMKIVVEPSGAVALAVVLFNAQWRSKMRALMGARTSWHIGIVLSGGNTTVEAIVKLFEPTIEQAL